MTEDIICCICGCRANSLECTTTGVVTWTNGAPFCDVCCGGLPSIEEAIKIVEEGGRKVEGVITIPMVNKL